MHKNNSVSQSCIVKLYLGRFCKYTLSGERTYKYEKRRARFIRTDVVFIFEFAYSVRFMNLRQRAKRFVLLTKRKWKMNCGPPESHNFYKSSAWTTVSTNVFHPIVCDDRNICNKFRLCRSKNALNRRFRKKILDSCALRGRTETILSLKGGRGKQFFQTTRVQFC